MTISTKLDEKLEGVDNLQAWKYRIILVLEENDLEGFIEANIPEPEGDKDKEKHKKILVKEKRIIDHSRLHQGSFDSSCIISKDSKPNGQCFVPIV